MILLTILKQCTLLFWNKNTPKNVQSENNESIKIMHFFSIYDKISNRVINPLFQTKSYQRLI